MKHHATAHWIGTGKNGSGQVTTKSFLLDKSAFSFNSRFADARGTNPEELLAAAHATCFTMKLSFVLGEAGYEPGSLETTCYISFENGFITGSQLIVRAKVAGIPQDVFDACISETKETSPMTRIVNTTTTIEAVLLG
jgi:lipoyl-dependent peroxiredoxin